MMTQAGLFVRPLWAANDPDAIVQRQLPVADSLFAPRAFSTSSLWRWPGRPAVFCAAACALTALAARCCPRRDYGFELAGTCVLLAAGGNSYCWPGVGKLAFLVGVFCGAVNDCAVAATNLSARGRSPHLF